MKLKGVIALGFAKLVHDPDPPEVLRESTGVRVPEHSFWPFLVAAIAGSALPNTNAAAQAVATSPVVIFFIFIPRPPSALLPWFRPT